MGQQRVDPLRISIAQGDPQFIVGQVRWNGPKEVFGPQLADTIRRFLCYQRLLRNHCHINLMRAQLLQQSWRVQIIDHLEARERRFRSLDAGNGGQEGSTNDWRNTKPQHQI